MDIIMQAYQLAEAVSSLTDHVRQFFYQVMLSGHTCPQCHGSLEMTEEHTARCRSCSFELDPTVAFQRCSCGGSLELRICRYRCRTCGSDVQSRFVFDGIVLDPAYFSQKMAESRQRRRELRERVRSVLADTRSEALVVPPADASQVADLANALDELTRTSESELVQLKDSSFDLQNYQRHIQAHTRASRLAP